MTEQMLTSGLLNWYPWREGASVHFVGDCSEEFKQDIISRGVVEKTTPPFDYVVAVRALEQSENPEDTLQTLKSDLKVGGHLFLACENRLGLQYFAGDYDPYTNHVMDGIENYPGLTEQNQKGMEGRCYARYEIERFLKKTGFDEYRGYSILPGLMMPQQIYSWDYLPEEDLEIRYTALYHHPTSVFMDVAKVYNSLIQNGMFHQMANAYLIDCCTGDEFFEVKHVTTSMDRGRDNAVATVICQNELVYKFALYPEGCSHIDKLLENAKELEKRNIPVIPMAPKTMGKCEGKELTGCSMPYIQAPTVMQYLRTLVYQDREKFIEKTTEFLDKILASSSEVPGTEKEELAPIYEKTYIDLVPLNSFYVNDTFVFFDQEFCETKYPIGVVLARTLDIIYMGDKRMKEIVPISYFSTRYGLERKMPVYRAMGDKYIKELRNRERLISYNSRHLVDYSLIDVNRQKINYSAADYQRIFVDLMWDVRNKKIFVFGSGVWAKKFIAEYGEVVHIEALLDNNREKQGQFVDGVKVESPDVLVDMNPDDYKVFLCIKQFSTVLRQLLDAGVKNYGIYNPNIERPAVANLNDDVQEIARKEEAADIKPKKYHLGYIAGVFDLFHIGHLNLLRRAKEQCDILLVGVVSDEQARSGKAHAPYVGQQERKEIVQACKYVDKTFILPVAAAGTRDVYRKYHFDVQFSGSDYEHDASWLTEQAWLRSQGSDIVFFPYTETTSSTKLKEVIEARS